MDQRNAARVFPDPVGAAIRVSSPRAIAGQPCTWASVGVPKRSRNQTSTRGENETTGPPSYHRRRPPASRCRRTKRLGITPLVPAAPTSPSGRAKRNRAAARREVRAAPARPAPIAPAGVGLPFAMTALWWVATGLFLGFTAWSMDQKITWYLAVDQYGYLAFGHDLAAGHVFHHWPPLDAFVSRLPAQVDVLVQTYVYDHGKLYCRYAPGF